MALSSIPKLPFFLETDRPLIGLPTDLRVRWSIRVATGYHWELRATSVDDPQDFAAAQIDFGVMPELIVLEGSLRTGDGLPIRVTPNMLFDQICGGYDFAAACAQPTWSAERKPRIAFTVLAGSQRGGGTIQLYRYANWLVDLGFSVTIYSDDATPPAWADLKARYVAIESDIPRYAAISEEVVLVYSILELPGVLQSRDRSNQRILHFCQGLEEFHFGESFSKIMTPKPIFRFLNSLPVGRIVVSPALANYFRNEFHQQAFLIPNGIDPLFGVGAATTPRRPQFGMGNRPIRIVSVGNPGQVSKGALVILEALGLLGQRYSGRRLNFHVDFISGPNPTDNLTYVRLPVGVSYGIKSGLSPAEMLREYQTADLVINASFHEGFGLSTIEALASGALVIQADNFGLDGLVEEDTEVIVVPRNNVTALATAIGTLLEIPEMGDRVAGRGPVVAERLSISHQFEAFVDKFGVITASEIDSELIKRLRPQETSGSGPVVEVREPPRFSVLVPVYNHAHFLPEALDTLRAQSYPHWEAIVVNDGSTDNTPEIMSRYATLDTRFRTFHRENGGTAAALNTALEHSSNEWITWLSSDDFFKSEKLEIHARYIESLPDVRFFHSLFSTYDDDTKSENLQAADGYQSFANPGFQTIDMCLCNGVHGNTVAVQRDLFRRVGGFRSEYPSAQDFDMWLRLSLETRFFLINKITCTTRIHEGSGTVQFHHAGIFDSYRSIVDVLNDRTFDQLVPFLDLSHGQGLTDAVVRALTVSLQGQAFLYQGATWRRSILIEKIWEYYSALKRSSRERELISWMMDHVRAGMRCDPSLAHALLPQFRRFEERAPQSFQYEPIDPFREMLARYESLLRLGDLSGVCIFRLYFEKLQRSGVKGVPNLDDIFGDLSSPLACTLRDSVRRGTR
jgi:glycosyltransferase involved in cell wall biosynthesis